MVSSLAAADDELLAVGREAHAARTGAGLEGADDLILRVEDAMVLLRSLRDEDEAGLRRRRGGRSRLPKE